MWNYCEGDYVKSMKDIISNEYGHCHYCVCHFDDCAMIYNLHIEKEYRRKGHATDFIQRAINKIRATGYVGDIKIVAEPEDNSISKETLVKFYEKMGLKIVD